jgi:GH15 family glucan-1,4-alpha-glucosidase
MDRVGQHASSHRFHAWAAETIYRHADRAEAALDRAARGDRILDGPYLHTRYTPEGRESAESWPNFQLDGLGSWLWSLREHLELSGVEVPREWAGAVELTARYLEGLWREPCFDCWEEPVLQLYTYTLAALYAGLQAAARLVNEPRFNESAQRIRDFLCSQIVDRQGLTRYLSTDAIDGSLIGVSTPYRLLPPEDPRMQTAVRRIESELRVNGGGVHRYAADTYYGGGEWILLTAWLAWHYTEIKEQERALELVAWVEDQADESGELPEQVARSLRDPAMYERWRRWWGESAKPLLWSHAMYLIARSGL